MIYSVWVKAKYDFSVEVEADNFEEARNKVNKRRLLDLLPIKNKNQTFNDYSHIAYGVMSEEEPK